MSFGQPGANHAYNGGRLPAYDVFLSFADVPESTT